MRVLLLLLVFALPAIAEDNPPPAQKKKPAATRPAKKAGKASQQAHMKPTPDQIRKFDQLEKQEEREAEPKKK